MDTTDDRTTTVTTPIPRERRGTFDLLRRRARTKGGRALVAGEVGIGKSYLMEQLVRSADPGRLVLFTRATEFDQQPFAGLADLVAGIPGPLLAHLDEQQEQALGTVLEHGPAGRSTPLALQSAVNRLLLAAAPIGLTIVVDEWQWLDPESRRVLERAVLQPAIGTVAALVAARRTDGSPDDFAVRPLFMPTDVVPVTPLTAESLRAVLVEAGMGGLPSSTLAEVVRTSGGNPLWAIELAAAHAAGDPRRAGATSVLESMLHRLGTLSPDAHAALAAAAVLGRAPLADLSAVCALAEPAVREAIAVGVLRIEGTTVVPAHPLLAAAAVHALDPVTERKIHAAIALLPISAARRAEHRDRSVPPGPDEQVAAELSAFSAAARRAGATESALRLVRRAVARSAPHTPALALRTVEAAELAYAIGNWALVLELGATVDQTALPLELFERIVPVTLEATTREGGAPAARRYLTDLQHAVPASGHHARVVEVHAGTRMPGGSAGIARMTRLAEALPSDRTPLTVATALYWSAFLRVDAGQGVDDTVLTRMRALHDRSEFVALEDTADAIEALLAHQADDLSRSRAKLVGFVRAAQLSGEVYATVQGLAHAAIVETLAGRLDLGGQRLEDAERQARDLATVPPSLYRARALLALARDDRATVEDVERGGFDPAAEFRGSLLQVGVAGLDAAYDGRWAEAATLLGDALVRARRAGIEEPGRRLWLDVELGRALVHVGDLDGARAVAAHLHVIGRRPDRVHARGQAARIGALLALATGRAQDAFTLSTRAIEDLRRGGLKPEWIRARVDHLAVLEATARTAEARHLLAALETEAAALGDPRVVAAVADRGQRLEQQDKRGQLTAAEVRVADEAASGKTNREIASDLFLSVRTVETHLASAYRKLGVQSRTQLALSLTTH